MIKNKSICFIGAGSMAEAIISGVVRHKLIPETNISVTNRQNDARLQQLSERYGVLAARNNETEYISNAHIIVLAVKPYAISDVIAAIRPYTHPEQLLISVLAGTSTQAIAEMFDHHIPIIRSMPNTSAVVGESATAICASKNVDQAHVTIARELFESIGFVLEVNESRMDAITAVSGSGPAYVYYFVEAMMEGARKIGLDEEQSRQLVLQTLTGASKMLVNTGKTAQQLREEVTSPNGTTAHGIQTLEHYSVKQAVVECMTAARDRARQLGKRK